MKSEKQKYQIISGILTDYLNTPYKYQNVESKLIVNRDNNDYAIFVYGVHNTESVHECIFHLQIDDDKIIVRRDNTKSHFFDKLLNARIASDKIIYPDTPQLEITDYTVSLEKIYELHSSLFEVKDNFTKALKLDVTSAQIKELAAIKHEYLNCLIANHPNTPPDLLKDFFPKFPLQILTNPIMDLLLLEQPKFIEELYKTYSHFFKKNNVTKLSEVRKWAAEKKQEDVDIKTSISNITPTFILAKAIDTRRHHIVQNLWKNNRLPLNTKNNPKETMGALDSFLSDYFGDNQVEYKPDLAALEARQLPLPLKYLYSFIGKYPGKHGEWLQTQDTIVDGTEIIREKRLFLVENQGVWLCGTELEGYDPPVWIEEENTAWRFVCDSLSQFLITFCFQEAIFASKYFYFLEDSQENIISTIKKENLEVTLLWQGTYTNDIYEDNDYNFKFRNYNYFYLVEDSILIWNDWCGTNYQNADKLLTSLNLKLRRCN